MMERLSELYRQYYSKTASAEQTAELMQLIHTASADELSRLIAENGESLGAINHSLEPDKVEMVLQYILRKSGSIDAGAKIVELQSTGTSPRIRYIWRKIAVAASIILAVGVGSYFLFFNHTKQNEIVQTREQRFKDDVDPGKYKARLTLADGSTIILDSAAIGELAKQGKTVVINKDGQLVYESGVGRQVSEVMYNTLSTAKGETYATVLADGSKVWLNSGSSIKFPVEFAGNERKVEITGEAYFEIAASPNPSKGGALKPFIVEKGDLQVTVLGTHFNVNAYDDEDDIKVTLLEGSVKVSNRNENNLLKPGEQAVLTHSLSRDGGNSRLTTNDSPDLEKITAWKNNVFLFSGDDIQTIMRQLGRWYDVDVEFNGQITDRHFTGIISRNNKVSEILKMLQATEKIKFEIDGRKITVSK